MRSCKGNIWSSQAITTAALNSIPLARCIVPMDTRLAASSPRQPELGHGQLPVDGSINPAAAFRRPASRPPPVWRACPLGPPTGSPCSDSYLSNLFAGHLPIGLVVAPTRQLPDLVVSEVPDHQSVLPDRHGIQRQKRLCL